MIQLANGDRLQVPENAWATMAHRLKVISNQRGRKYSAHTEFHDVIERIAGETEDPKQTLFLSRVAIGLH